MREVKYLSILLQIAPHTESEQYCALPNDLALAIDRYSPSQDRSVQRGYELDNR